MGPGTRLRDLPIIPVLVLLHLLFTLSSLLLRIYQSLFQTTPIVPSIDKPPVHLGVVFVTGRDDVRERRAMVESVRRVAQWASSIGVKELSIWEKNGLVHRHRDEVIPEVMGLPPTPPSSGPSSPRQKAALPSENPSTEDVLTSSCTYTLRPGTGPSTLTIHLLPPSSSSVISQLTQTYVDTGMSTDKMSVKSVNEDVRCILGFSADPDLLIVHPLSPPSFPRSLLPRPPPELHGYPFWALRITEIYQHPTPLPIPSVVTDIFRPILYSAQMSTLSLMRKTARLLPLTEPPRRRETIAGATTKEEWTGAMTAWSRVEQRLGK